MGLAELFEFVSVPERKTLRIRAKLGQKIRKDRRRDIMLCALVYSKKGSDIISQLKAKIEEKYQERAGKFSPPLVFRDLGDLGEFYDSLEQMEREVGGFCIVSVTGANPEWFSDILRDAVRELREEGVAGIVREEDRPIFEIFEERRTMI